MRQERPTAPGFLDLLSSPWTLLPLGAGATLLLAAWALEPETRVVLFLGIAGMVVGLSMLATQWLLGAPALHPDQERMRQELLDSLETADRAEPWASCREAEQAGTPAARGP